VGETVASVMANGEVCRRLKGKQFTKRGGINGGLITFDNFWFHDNRICYSRFYEKKYGT